MRAASSLPAPAGPVISTREPVGATLLDRRPQLRDGSGGAEQLRLRPGAQAQFRILALQPGSFQRTGDNQAAAGRP